MNADLSCSSTLTLVFLEAVQRCKKDLDEQVKQKLARAEQEKRESEAQIDDLRRQTMEHETHQAKLREATRKMLLVRIFLHVHTGFMFAREGLVPTLTAAPMSTGSSYISTSCRAYNSIHGMKYTVFHNV